MNLAKINEVIKASPAIQIQSKISLLQRRAWNVLLANAYNELPTAEIHRVSVVELAAKLGYNSNDLDYLKETLEALGSCQVKWNLLGKDKSRAEKVREKELEDLTAEFRIKRDNILRQAVHAEPELVERAAERIQSYMVRERLSEHDSVMEVYQKGGMIKAEIDGILAAEFCQDLLAPVQATYEDEKARILEG